MPAALLLAVALVSQWAPTWLALGTRTVTRDADHDSIAVSGDLDTWHAVKLTAIGSPVRFIRVVLHFENGAERPHRLHELVPDGGQSHSIGLKGDERALRRIDFWYDAKSVGRKGAVVQLIGRH
jgi:hypothetical protein